MGIRENRFKIIFFVESCPSQRGEHSSVQDPLFSLSSLKRVSTQPPFQLAVTTNGTRFNGQHTRTPVFTFAEVYDLKLFTTLYLSSLLREAIFIGRGSLKRFLIYLLPDTQYLPWD